MKDISAPATLADLTAHGRVLLQNAHVPACLLAAGAPAGSPVDAEGGALVDLLLDGPTIAAISAPGAILAGDARPLALAGRHLWPMLVDMHTHLDKGHVLGRAPESGGTHMGARQATTADRLAHWRHDDLLRRMRFGLACAEAHGVAALRTHLDSHEGQAETSWGALAAARAEFAGRVAVQAVALVPVDAYLGDYGAHLADLVAAEGGLLGGVTRAAGGTHQAGGMEELDAILDRLFTLARERDLDVDLHVDEAAVAGALAPVARATLRHGYEGRVTCGHCCSLANLPAAEAAEVIALVAEAGLSIVTLPTVNLYLQDRAPGRSPRWRGVTPVAELRAAGVAVAVAGDNCRDPFHAYGDHDMLDTWRQAVRILHLDHPFGDAPALAGPVPGRLMGLGSTGSLAVGGPADLMLLQAWSLDQVMARPQSDRVLVKGGALSTARLPSYQELAAI
jgi:cytosine/creatinine deaminase